MTDTLNEDLAVLKSMARQYGEALWVSDSEALRTLFHPKCRLYGNGETGVDEHTLEEWLAIVSARAPGEGDAPVEIKNALRPATDLGIIALDCAVSGRRFTDTLSFLKTNGSWHVIAKTYHIRGDDD